MSGECQVTPGSDSVNTVGHMVLVSATVQPGRMVAFNPKFPAELEFRLSDR